MSLSVEANERLYDALAEAIDRVGAGHEAPHLIKLVLLLANRLGDAGAVEEAVAEAFEPIGTPL